ncbi:MAG: PAS domain S-box protein [Chitinophagaceae bacterium]|nr:PAS domain S-box protein [Chitinophagaceae bacterium]
MSRFTGGSGRYVFGIFGFLCNFSLTSACLDVFRNINTLLTKHAMNWSARKILLLMLFLTVVLVAVSVYISINQSNKINETFVSIGHTQDILYSAEKLISALKESQSMLKEYALTGEEGTLVSIQQLNKTTEEAFLQLESVAANDVKHQARIDSLSFFVDEVLAFTSVVTSPGAPVNNADVKKRDSYTRVKANITKISELIRNIENEEQGLLQQRQRTNINAIASFKSVLYVGLGLLIILMIMLAQKRRLDVMADKTVDSVVKYNALLLEHIRDAVISTDKEFKIITWNKKAEDIFGWTQDEVRGKKVADTLSPVFYGETGNGIIKKLLQKGSWEGEVTLYKKDRTPVTLLLSGAMIGKESGKITGVVTIAKDISARKEVEESLKKFNLQLGKQVEDRTAEIKNIIERLVGSEKKYRLLFDNNPLPMWMITLPDLNITDVNDAAIQQYGYARRSFLQMNARGLLPREEIARFESNMLVLEAGYQNAGVWKQLKKNGTLFFAELFTYDLELNGKSMLLVLSNDVTEKIKAEQQLRQSLEEIRMLSGHLQEVREEERKSIAREIHDELGQQLTVLKMDIAWAIRKLNDTDPDVIQRLRELMEMIDATIKTVRRICSELRPVVLDDLGLAAAMEWHARIFEKNTGLSIQLDISETDINYPADMKTGLFRIYQESLTNTARHAQASNVEVRLRVEEGAIVLRIVDDGKGFDIETVDQKKTLGILGMKERSLMMGGRYTIESSEGKGTAITVIIPLEHEAVEVVGMMKE